MNPKVSIIIPVYNWSNYLWEAINSALNQTYKNIEILVINDGSNDNGATKQIALSFDEKIKYYEKDNWWVATALNLWIKKATWEYISWLSHDDLYHINKIKEQIKLLNTLEKKENKIICTNFNIINEKNKIINKIKYKNKININFEIIKTTSFINWCTLIIPKKVFNTIWYFDIKLKTTQDYNMWIRLIKWWYKFIHLNKTLVNYRIHNKQDSINKKQIMLKEVNILHKYIITSFSKEEIKKISSLKINKYLIYLYIKHCYIKQKILFYITIKLQKIWLYDFLKRNI